MKDINAYLFFEGNCREAMNFYQSCLGGKTEVMTFEGSPMEVPDEYKDKVMHACLMTDELTLMASDSMPGQPVNFGNSVSLSINYESEAEINRLFPLLAQDGQVTMALQDTFWGARFGSLIDKFGINWMLNYDKPK